MGFVSRNFDVCKRELERFFHNCVTISTKEREKNDNTVMRIVNQIFAKVKKKDSRFVELKPVGSAFQRLKTAFPDEYDINIVINTPKDFAARNWDLFHDKNLRFYDFKRNVEEELRVQNLERKRSREQRWTKAAGILTLLGVFFSLCAFFLYGFTNSSKEAYISVIIAIVFFVGGLAAYLTACCNCSDEELIRNTPSFEIINLFNLIEKGVDLSENCITYSEKPLSQPGKGEVYFRLNDKEFNERWANLTYQEDLIPVLVKKRMKQLLQEAALDISNNYRNFSMEFESEGSGTAVTCTLSHPELMRNVSIDFSPVLQNIAPLPDPYRWDGRHFRWPKQQTIRNMKKMGVCLVPRNDFHWKISTSMLDAELMESIKDNPHTNGCRRKSHRILKQLNEQFFCNSRKPVIFSYVLKHILFWECEEFPEDRDWANRYLTVRVISMTKKLLKGVQNGFIGNYSCKDLNVFRIKNRKALMDAEKEIEAFLMDPARYLMNVNCLWP